MYALDPTESALVRNGAGWVARPVHGCLSSGLGEVSDILRDDDRSAPSVLQNPGPSPDEARHTPFRAWIDTIGSSVRGEAD